MKAKEGEDELLDQFWEANHYVAGNYDSQEDFEHLNQEVAALEKDLSNRLFYLALPPSVFKPVTSMLKVSRTPRFCISIDTIQIRMTLKALTKLKYTIFSFKIYYKVG